MKKKITALLVVFTMLITSNLFSAEALASEVPLSVGQKFTVSDITYCVTSNTEVEAISAALKLTTITIPGSVTYNGVTYGVASIPSGAFYGNVRATKIVISEGVKRIGSTAFQKADAVTEIVLPSTLETFTTIGFKSLSTITLAASNPYFQLKDGVLYSRDGSTLWLYPSAKAGTSYTVPAGTVTIAEAAFYENQNLQTLVFASTVKTLENYALYHMNGLNTITLDGISTIGNHNLRYCGNLRSLTIRNTRRIGDYCVYDCGSLETITISGSMSGYGTYSFYNLPSLKSYNVQGSNAYSSKDGVLFGGSKLLRYPAAKAGSTYLVPDGTTGIAGLAFNSLRNTTEIILNPGVTLDLMAFHYPHVSSPMNIYFRDKTSVSMSKSSTGVFVGLVSGSNIFLPRDASLQSFQSYGNAVNPKGSATVSKRGIGATGLTISQSKAEIEKGDTLTLSGSMAPTYTTDDIHWSSDDSSIATVSADGVVTAVKKGKCTITAATDSGVKKTCSITVVKTETTSSDKSDSDSKDTTSKKEKDDSTSSKKDSKNETKEDSKSKNSSKTDAVKNEKKESILDKCIDFFTGDDKEDGKDSNETKKSEKSKASDGTGSNSKEVEEVSDGKSYIGIIILGSVLLLGGTAFLVRFILKKKGLSNKIAPEDIEIPDESDEE